MSKMFVVVAVQRAVGQKLVVLLSAYVLDSIVDSINDHSRNVEVPGSTRQSAVAQPINLIDLETNLRWSKSAVLA